MRSAKPVLRALLVFCVALVAAPGAADAATYTLRPNATLQQDLAWATLPSGALDAVLANPLLEPALPLSTSPVAVAATGDAQYARVAVPAPALAADEVATGATAWVHAQVGTYQQLSIGLASGESLLASTSLAPGQPAGWHRVRFSSPLSAAQLAQLSIVMRSDGLAGLPATTTLAASYVEIETTVGSAGTTVVVGDGKAKTDGGGQTDGGLQTTKDGVRHTGAALTLPPVLGPPVQIVETPISVSRDARRTRLDLACPPAATGACRGQVTMRFALPPKRRGQAPLASSARCARGCRVIARGNFSIAAGNRQRVRLDVARSARRRFARGGRMRVVVKVRSRDFAGRVSVSRRRMVIGA